MNSEFFLSEDQQNGGFYQFFERVVLVIVNIQEFFIDLKRFFQACVAPGLIQGICDFNFGFIFVKLF